MNAGEAIYHLLSTDAAVSTIVASRIYPLYAPQTRKAPFVTYQQVGNTPSNTKSGPSPLDQILFQVNCIAQDPDGALTLKKAVRQALDCKSVVGIQSIRFMDERAMWDNESQLEGAAAYSQDYSIREIQ